VYAERESEIVCVCACVCACVCVCVRVCLCVCMCVGEREKIGILFWGEFKLMWRWDGNGCLKSVGTETEGSKGECTKHDRTDGVRKQGREQGKSRLNCIYYIARGLTGEGDELRAWMGTWDWDIIAIAETWRREGQDWQLNVPRYRFYEKDRTGGKKGGEVAFD